MCWCVNIEPETERESKKNTLKLKKKKTKKKLKLALPVTGCAVVLLGLLPFHVVYECFRLSTELFVCGCCYCSMLMLVSTSDRMESNGREEQRDNNNEKKNEKEEEEEAALAVKHCKTTIVYSKRQIAAENTRTFTLVASVCIGHFFFPATSK